MVFYNTKGVVMKKRLLSLLIFSSMLCVGMDEDRSALLSGDDQEPELCDRVEIDLGNEEAMWVAELLDSRQEFDSLDGDFKAEVKQEFPYLRVLFHICDGMQENTQYTRVLPSGKLVMYLKEKRQAEQVRKIFQVLEKIDEAVTIECFENDDEDDLARRTAELKKILYKKKAAKAVELDEGDSDGDDDDDILLRKVGSGTKTPKREKKKGCCILL